MTDPVEIARLFLFVREAGQNSGQRVEAIQKWGGGQRGDSWCAFFATMVLDLAYQGAAPILRQGGVQDIRDVATKSGWITDTPSVGDLFLYINADDHAHHVGFVSSVDPLLGIAGNTDANGTSSNGDRVAEHAITAKTFIAYPRA